MTCKSIGEFSVFLPFLFDSWEESHGAKWIKTGSGRFHTWATADCYTSLTGGKNREDPKESNAFSCTILPKKKVWTQCLSQPHTIWVQFFVIVHSCWLLETSVVEDKSKKKQTKKLVWRQTMPTFHCGGLVTVAQITPWWRKNFPQHCHMPFHYHIAWMESDIHIFYVCEFCHLKIQTKATLLVAQY